MLLKTTAIVTSFNILNTILHFVFGLLLAYFFGASAEMDAYVVASNFIITLNALFVQAQTKSFIPFIAEYEKDIEKLEIIASIIRFNIVVFLTLSVLLFLFASQISFLLAPGLSHEQLLLTAKCLKILAIFILFSNLSGICAGIIEYDLKFKKTALLNFVQAVLLVVILVLSVKLIGVFSIPVAHVSSIGISVMYYLYMYKKSGHTFYTSFTLYNKYIKKYIVLLLPIMLASIFTWLIQFADTFIASFFDTGSISYLSYCQKIIRHVSVISNSICVIYFPILSKLNTKNDDAEFLKTFYGGIQKIFVIAVFMTTFILLFKEPIVRLLFERGSFASGDTLHVSGLITYFSLVFICSPMGAFLAGAYYSRQETKKATTYSIISSITNVLLNVVLGYLYGIKGLAAASSMAFLVGNFLQIGNISKVVSGYTIGHTIRVLYKSLLTSIIVFVLFYFLKDLIMNYSEVIGIMKIFIYLGVNFIFYLILFMIIGYVLNVGIIRKSAKSIIGRLS